MRKLVIILGVTSQAVSVILAVFMAGLGLGSLLIGAKGDRIRSPLRFYAILEILIGLYGLTSLYLLELAQELYVDMSQASTNRVILRIVLTSATLIIPTALMGATFPVIGKALARKEEELGRSLGYLYSVNTLGAACGVVAVALFLVFYLGLSGSLLVAATLNIIAGIGAWLLATSSTQEFSKQPPLRVVKEDRQPQRIKAAYLSMFLTGAFALSLEVLWTRYLIYVLRANSTYAFASMLAAFLLGIVLGSYICAKRIDRDKDPLQVLAAAVTVMGLGALFTVPLIAIMVSAPTSGSSFYTANFVMLISCFVTLGIPTTASGAAFAAALKLGSKGVSELSHDSARLYALNTFGAILGSILGGFFLLPALGLKAGIILVGSLNSLFGIMLLRSRPQQVQGIVALFLLLVLSMISGNPVEQRLLASDDKLLFYEDGPESSIAVIEKGDGERQFVVDGDIQAGSSPSSAMSLRLLGHLPPLIHPNAKSALVICLGTGITASSMLLHPVSSLDIVELSRSVPKIQPLFESWNRGAISDSRVTLYRDDGRNFLLSTARKYDVITTDPLDPDDAGMALLYSKEFYALQKAHLNEGGVVSQWFPPPANTDLEHEHYRMLIRTFLEVFPDASLWLADFTSVIVGINGKPEISEQQFLERAANENVRRSLELSGITSPQHLRRLLVAGPAELREYVGGGRLNTDNTPYLEYLANRNSRTNESNALVSLQNRFEGKEITWFPK